MADKASKFDPKEIADVAQNTLRKFTSLDTPQDMTAAETAADIAAGFVPGVGTAQSARDFERARREGDKLGMGLSAVGMIPVVGGVVKPARKAARSLVEMAEQYGAKAAPQEQKMLQGFYRGYAGDYDAARAAAQDSGVFVTPQRAVGEYYANKRAAQTGAEPHLEMILADPFAGRGYGHSTLGTGKNPPMITRARELAPEDVKDRTQLYAAGGAVADTDVKSWLAANSGATDYDIAAAMKKYDVAPEQVSRVTGIGMPEVQARYAVARPKTDEEVKQFLTSQPGMTDPQIANAMRMYNVAPEQVSRAINMGLPEVKLRYAFASPPPPQPQPASGGGNNGTRKALDDLASMYSIGTYFIPGMQFAAPIDYALRGLSLANTIKDIGKKFGFKEGGAVEYDVEEIDRLIQSTTGEKPSVDAERPLIPENRSLPFRVTGMGDERAGMYRGRFEMPIGEYTAGIGAGGMYYNTPTGRKFTMGGREISGSMPFLGGRLSGSYYSDPASRMREARINYSRQFAAGGPVNCDPT